MLSLAIITVFVLSIGVGIYTLIPFILALKKKKSSKQPGAFSHTSAVSVLIPCHNEGEEVIEAIESVLASEGSLDLSVFVLLKDNKDSSFAFLQRYGKEARVKIVETGFQYKKDKLNFILPQLVDPYVFFLDADHAIEKNLISSLINYLEKNKAYSVVQARRKPKQFHGFFQLWDSFQNHLGNEYVQEILKAHNQSIYFTGTTALFRREVFDTYSFSHSLTEDTYLSYDLLCNGYHIGYVSSVASYESVSPYISDYIARRRRWAQGHSHNFFSHLTSIFNSSFLSLRQKIQMLMHGSFYLIPLLSFIPVIIVSIFIVLQFPSEIQKYVVLGSVLVSLIFSLLQYRSVVRNLIESLTASLLTFPFITIFTTWILSYTHHDIYPTLISFPYLNEVLGIYLGILSLLPLLFGLFAQSKLKQLSMRQVLVLIVSYPLILIIDLYAIILGHTDILLRNFKWKSISRKRVRAIPYTTLLFILGISLLIYSGYRSHFFSMNMCGENAHPFGAWNQKHILEVDVQKNIITDTSGTLEVVLEVRTHEDIQSVEIRTDRGTNTVSLEGGTYRESWIQDLGFDTFEIEITQSRWCKITKEYTNTIREIQDNTIILNGEPFFVKGIIPSYTNRNVSLSHKEGIVQLQKLGANTLRFYHEPSLKLQNILEEQQIMAMVQPSLSNWNATDLRLRGSFGLLRRYQKLQASLSSHPYILSISLGNEIEINSLSRINTIYEMLSSIQEQDSYEHFSSYASFYPSINYPSDILGVNMLDTGATYWEKALPILSSFDKPFIATELGGFEAFYERTDPILRKLRLRNQWDALVNQGFSGAMLFQSHDNWGQPVPEGYNNPFTDEHPDDLRGLYTKDNKEKSIIPTIQDLYADMKLDFDITETKVTMTLVNIRPYTLRNIHILDSDLFDLVPNETKRLDIERSLFDSNFELIAQYETHRGIRGYQELHTPILQPYQQPFFDNAEILEVSRSQDHISIIPLSDTVSFSGLEGWDLPLLNDRDPYTDAVIEDIYFEGKKGSDLPSGNQQGQFDIVISSPDFTGASLLIEGTGASELYISDTEKTYIFNTHPYREQKIPLSWIEDDTEILNISFLRKHVDYLSEAFNPRGEEIYIDMQKPMLFKPQIVEIRRK